MEGLWLLEVQWDLEEGHHDLCLLLGQECLATCLGKVSATWSLPGRKREHGLKLKEVGGEGGEENLTETEVGGGRRTGELLMIGTGGIEETLGEGEKVVVGGGIITGEKENGRKMMGGEGKGEEEGEGERREEEVKVQAGVGRGAGSEEEAMTGGLILMLEVITSGFLSIVDLFQYDSGLTPPFAQVLKIGVMETCLTVETPSPLICLCLQRR